MTTTEAALRDALKTLCKVRHQVGGRLPNALHDAFVDAQQALSQPSPASSTAGEGDDYKRGIYAAKCWLRDQQHKNPPDSLWHAAAILADRMDVALLSPSSGEPASVAVEAEARLLDIAAERAAQIRSSCFDYCTGDCNCAQAAEDAVSEMERLVAALAEPASPAPVGEQGVAAGWQLVPVEITQAMLDATCCDVTDDDEMRAAWKELLRSAPKPPVGGGETIESMIAWGDETFGPCEPSRAVSRAGEEWNEMVAEIPGTMQHAIEAADVIICLLRIPLIREALNAKMAKNRARKWKLMGDGTGYHVKDATPATTTTERGRG